MRFSEVINLLKVTTTENAMGDIIESETSRQVFANKLSVKRAEFYQAMATGLRPELVFTVRLIDYEGEENLSFEGEAYNIIRTYTKDGEFLELICNKLVSNIEINLTALVLSNVVLAPVFADTTYTYTSTVLNAVNTTTVTATCLQATQITVNGVVVESGVASGSIALLVGVNVITIVMRKTAKPTKTYTITITRSA